MNDLLEQGATWLTTQQRTHAAKVVTYQRGQMTLSVAATLGQSEHGAEDLSGGQHLWISRDFLITVVDLVISGQQLTPQRGDRIIEDRNGRRYTHEVASDSGSSDCWKYADAYRTTYRIYTKTIKAEDVPE